VGSGNFEEPPPATRFTTLLSSHHEQKAVRVAVTAQQVNWLRNPVPHRLGRDAGKDQPVISVCWKFPWKKRSRH